MAISLILIQIHNMASYTILGSGGIISNSLAAELIRNNEMVKLVSRNPKQIPGATIQAADITDLNQAIQAVEPSSLVFLCIGLKYDFSVWREQWPKIMNNVIEACKQKKSKLIFFDNVYMYGKVEGPMTEDCPYNPSSRKGDLRARIATQLMSEVRKGNITATIARAADFYGPGADKTAVLNLLVFANLAAHKKAQWMVNDSAIHSFTYTPDAAKALYLLAKTEDSWNQVWHLPTTSNPFTGREYIRMIADTLCAKPDYRILHKWMIRLAGLFNRTVAELYEMAYQYEFDYLFDSSKFEKAFNYKTVPYADGIKAVAETYKKP